MKKLTLLFLTLFYFKVSADLSIKISNLVEPVRYFVNHESQLDSIREKLSLYKKTTVFGMSGIGKTQLVRRYANEHQNEYNLIWFFDCNSDLSAQFSLLASDINKNFCKKEGCILSENVTNAKESVIKYLTAKSNWLLVFDNLKIKENYKVQDIIEWENNGHIIISSQDGQNMLHSIPIPYLKNTDSSSLASNILSKRDNKLIEHLVSLSKGYPIFIVQAAMFLDMNKYMALEEYIEIVNKSGNKMQQHVNLVINELSPTAKGLLYKMAVINNQRFSKKFLSIISRDQTFTEDLQSIIRFGLIANIGNSGEEPLFEMHDMVKKSILDIAGKNTIKNIIEETTDSINIAIPLGRNARYFFMLSDSTMPNSLQELLNNGELYAIDIYKILELRKNLMDYYLGYGNSLCQEMEDWFFKNKSTLNSLFINDSKKATYLEYLTLIGVYECYLRSSFSTGIKYLVEASDLLHSLDGHFEVKFLAYAKLAEAYVYIGDRKNARIFLERAESLIDKDQNNLEILLLWFIKSQIHLAEGNYQDALSAIQTEIEMDYESPYDDHKAILYVAEAEILNYMSNFAKAYDISKKVYDKEIEAIRDGSVGGSKLMVIVELARAELGLGKIKLSLEHAKEAISVYTKDESRNNLDISMSEDIELAAAFVAEGEALAALNRLEEAAQSFATAEAIFYNNYRDNMKNLDKISYLYWKAAKATCKLPEKFWFNKFKDQLIKKFGSTHPRSVEILNMK